MSEFSEKKLKKYDINAGQELAGGERLYATQVNAIIEGILWLNENSGSGGGSIDVDTEMSNSSENAVQNKVIKQYVDTSIAGTFSGNYNDLTNKPSIPSKTSDLQNDSGFTTFSGNYDDLSNKPTIPSSLSDLTDDATHRVVTDTDKTTWNNKSDFSGSYNDLSNKPDVYTKDETNDLLPKLRELSGNVLTKTWNGVSSFYGSTGIWTDGTNIYLGSNYVLNKSTSTWETKNWNGLSTEIDARYIWTDGTNTYYSSGSTQLVLNKATSTWSTKTWNGIAQFNGNDVWTDGENIYYYFTHVLNKSTSTWETKTWTNTPSSGCKVQHIWTDGENVYLSNGTANQYVLNKETSTWERKTWNGFTNFYGDYIWTDGEEIYYSFGSNRFVLNKATNTWKEKTWSGQYTVTGGENIWTDGENVYYSNGIDQEVFEWADLKYVKKVAVTGSYNDLDDKPTILNFKELKDIETYRYVEISPNSPTLPYQLWNTNHTMTNSERETVKTTICKIINDGYINDYYRSEFRLRLLAFWLDGTASSSYVADLYFAYEANTFIHIKIYGNDYTIETVNSIDV